MKQWHPGEFTVEALHRLLASGGEVYLARRDGAAAGGFTLQWEDVDPWGERPPDAGYLHALCVRRDDAGLGLGAALLDPRASYRGAEWAAPRCDSTAGAGNDALRAYNGGQGFTLRGLTEEHGYDVALYERASTAIPPPSW